MALEFNIVSFETITVIETIVMSYFVGSSQASSVASVIVAAATSSQLVAIT